MAVRLDKTLRATIDKVVASYNRKISRYKKLGYNVPKKAKYMDIASLPSRKSILSELKNMQKLNIKNVDSIVFKGHLTTIFEKQSLEKRLKKSTRLLKNRIIKLANTEFKMYGKETGYTFGDRASFLNLYNKLDKGQLRGDKLISSLRKYQRLSNTSLEDYYNFSESERESFNNLLTRIENPYINSKLKDNYLEALSDLGYAYGYDNEKLANMEKKLKKLTNAEFEKLFTEDLGIRKILSYYDILKINLGANNISDNRESVFDLYDNIYDNLDKILESYK